MTNPSSYRRGSFSCEHLGKHVTSEFLFGSVLRFQSRVIVKMALKVNALLNT